MNKDINLSRADKIIITIGEISAGKKKSLKYEDIVVAVFNKFPEDFHLKGYPQYPDTGDIIHKPLYEFRQKGFIEANSKIFSLTEMGLNYVQKLQKSFTDKEIVSTDRLSRFAENELKRIEKSEAFSLFQKNQVEKISDTDFYRYIGVTPRTSPNDFIGRMNIVKAAIAELKSFKTTERLKSIALFHDFLMSKYDSIVKHFNAD